MNDPRQRLMDLVAADQAAAAGPVSPMRLICDRCVVELDVSGAGATVLSHSGSNGNDPARGLVHASNDVASGLEELQLTVGEGPCLDTFDSGGPVLVADLKSEGARWPAFTQEALALGAAAVFSFRRHDPGRPGRRLIVSGPGGGAPTAAAEPIHGAGRTRVRVV